MTTRIQPCHKCSQQGCAKCGFKGSYTYHLPTLEEIKERTEEIEDIADQERYLDRSLGYTSDDFLDEVERSMWTDDYRWDLGSDTASPNCKAVKKILSRIRKAN
jgi:hypothetical protein